jgi:hypothetical protein
MSDEKSPTNPAIQILRGVLVVAAVLVLVAGCAVATALVSNHRDSNDALLLGAVSVVVGLVLAVLLIVASSIAGMLAVLVGRAHGQGADDVRPALERLEQSLRVLNNLQTRAGTDAARDAVYTTGLNGRSVPVLEQLRDITLMNDEQRKHYAQNHWAQRKRLHLEAIEREVLVGDWQSAFGRLAELHVVLPGDSQVAEMKERVESEQNSRLEEDVRIARNRLKQLMAEANWTQAEDLAGAIQMKYPGKAEPDRLVEEVRREREAWERENAQRLFRDIAAATEKRQWRHAVLAVEEFIRRYSLDPRAEPLRLDLPMLQENASTQERKEQEELFKDLLKRQKYDEALAVARAVIQKYPQSPTATELTKLMPRVEEMAKQEAAKQASLAGAAPVGAGA